jgi:hypothetical protein
MGIPAVAPPTIVAVNRIRLILRKNRNDFLMTFAAGTGIKKSFITPGDSPLQPAIGAKCGYRNGIFITAKNRRDFIVKDQIFVCNFKLQRALTAILYHTFFPSED